MLWKLARIFQVAKDSPLHGPVQVAVKRCFQPTLSSPVKPKGTPSAALTLSDSVYDMSNSSALGVQKEKALTEHGEQSCALEYDIYNPHPPAPCSPSSNPYHYLLQYSPHT